MSVARLIDGPERVEPRAADLAARAALIARSTHPAMAKAMRPPRDARPYFTGGSSSLSLARALTGYRLPGGYQMPPYLGEPVDSYFPPSPPSDWTRALRRR